MTSFDSHCLLLNRVSRFLGKEKFPAVTDVSLCVNRGEIHGLLGPNGAGKTTTVKMAATLLRPSSGEIRVGGVDAVRHPQIARRKLGLVLGGDMGFYPRATCVENLSYFTDLQGVEWRNRRVRINEALERVDLLAEANKPAQALSRGLKQRLHLARALLTQPDILLLDEPTTGLDPDVSLRVRDLVREIADSGTGILLTSHSMPELEELANEISLIGAGRIAVNGSVGEVAKFAGVDIISTFTVPASANNLDERLTAKIKTVVPSIEITQRAKSAQWVVTIFWPIGVGREYAEKLLTATLIDLNMDIPMDLVTRSASLEEIYLAVAERLAR